MLDKKGFDEWLTNNLEQARAIFKDEKNLKRNFVLGYAFADSLEPADREEVISDLDAANNSIRRYAAMIGDNQRVGLSEDEMYRRYAGEVEARNAASRLGMTDEVRRALLAVDTEDIAREDQVLIFGNDGINAMGTKVTSRMKEIAEKLKGVKLDERQRAVVDVFTGEKKKSSILIKDKEGNNRTIEFKQGGELYLGSKHAIFRHYGTKSRWFKADEVPYITNVLTDGERDEDGNNASYTLKINGTKYVVATMIGGTKEVFISFYTNRMTPPSDTQNTQESARAKDEVNHGAKVSEDFVNPKISSEKNYAEVIKGANAKQKGQKKGQEIAGRRGMEDAIQGLEVYSREEIKDMVWWHINDIIDDMDEDIEIKGMEIIGSRSGEARNRLGSWRRREVAL